MRQNLLLIIALIFILCSNQSMFASGPARDLDSSPVYVDGANYYSFFDSDDENGFKLYVSQGILNIKYPRPQELLNGEVIVYNLLGQ